MQKELRNYAFRNGCYLGVLFIFLTIIFYLFDSNALLPEINMYSVFFYGFLLIFPIYSIKRFKLILSIQQHSFKELFSIGFLILALSLFISMLQTIVLYNVIDQTLISDYVEFMNTKKDIYLYSGHTLDSYREMISHSFSVKMQFQSYVFSLIPCTLYSAVISLLMKKRNKL